jgi:V8-like Glu-specific endopeptidase
MFPRQCLGALLLLALPTVASAAPADPFSTAAGRCALPPPASPGAPVFAPRPFQGPERVGEEAPIALKSPEIRTLAGDGGSKIVWSTEIRRDGASYIAPHFSRFDLPPGAALVIRSPRGERSWKLSGTGKGNLGRTKGFWGIHIPGPAAVLELWASGPVPAGAVVLDRFAHGDPPLPGPQPDLICGIDDTEEAKCVQTREPEIYDHARAVARLLINGVSACTGWLIGSSGHLMTNWHCIGDAEAAANTDYEFMAEGPTCATDCRSWGACPGTVAAVSADFVKTNWDLDYTLLQLPVNAADTYGYLRLRESGPEIDERIYIAGHPAVWGKRIHDKSTSDASGHCTVNSLSESPCLGGDHTEVGYYCDSQGGSSGSPVLGYDDHLVVALHHCGGCLNTGVPVQPIIEDLGDDLPVDAIGSLCPGPGPAGLAAVAGTDRIDLSWSAVAGALDYAVYRAPASGGSANGPFHKIGTAAGTSFADEGLRCERGFVYTVRARLDGCVTPPSAAVPAATLACPACTVQTIYSNDFESAAGLADWTAGTFGGTAGTASWRGAQQCAARSGSHVFRFGGPECADNYSEGSFAFAQPGGSAGIEIPDGARQTRLSFWHRRAFENAYDGGTLALSLDGVSYAFLPGSTILGGTPYNGTIAQGSSYGCTPFGAAGLESFTGTSAGFTQTLVDLDAACDEVTGTSDGCAGRPVSLGFTAVSDCSVTDDGWFLDDVVVTACLPSVLPAIATDFYTLTPCRILDTRQPAGPLGGPALQPGAERSFAVAGTCGIPATATAVALNVTVTQGAGGGYVQVYPADLGIPLTSTVNFGAGQTRSNNAIVPLALDGSGAVKARAGTGQTVHLVLDVVGYFQ